MNYKRFLLFIGLFLFSLKGIVAQKNNSSLRIVEEPINLKGGGPLFDHLSRIVGRFERVMPYRENRGGIFKYTKRTKLITNTGKEILIDVLDKKVIYLEDAERIITYGKKNSGHTFKPTPEILIFDIQGNFIKHISPVNLSSYDIEITKKGEIYVVGAYDKDYKGSSLIKMDKNGNLLWKRGLSKAFKSLDPIKITFSYDEEKIAILQDRSFGKPQTLISVFGGNGDIISKIDSNRGIRKLQFFGDDKIIVYSKSVYCFYIYYLKNNGSENSKCFDSFIDLKSKEPHYLFIHPNQKYIGIYKNKSSEFVFVTVDDDKLNIINKIKISPFELRKIQSIIHLNNKIEIWQKSKKIELILK